jgi:hypothetical protein
MLSAEVFMRPLASTVFLLIVCTTAAAQQHAQLAQPTPSPAPQKISPKILAAKTVFFEDQSNMPAAGKATLEKLKTWGRFQIVSDKTQADLVILLSASPARDHLVYSGGQTGTIEKGNVVEDPVPNYLQSKPVRSAYLTVYDGKTGESLWNDSHRWGGLLTGFNSAGPRLMSELKKDCAR